jgi:hypothetical protein
MPPESAADETRDVQIAGETFVVSEITMGEVGRLQRFLAKIPAPPVPRQDLSGLAEAIALPPEGLDGLSPEARIRLAEQAQKQAAEVAAGQLREARGEAGDWPPMFGHPRSIPALLGAEGGPAELLYSILRPGSPGLNRKRAAELVEALRYRDFMDILVFAMGVDPAGGELSGPNASPGGGSSPTSGPATDTSPAATDGPSTTSTA